MGLTLSNLSAAVDILEGLRLQASTRGPQDIFLSSTPPLTDEEHPREATFSSLYMSIYTEISKVYLSPKLSGILQNA